MDRITFRTAGTALLMALLSTAACSSDGSDDTANTAGGSTDTAVTSTTAGLSEFIEVAGDDAISDVIEVRIGDDEGGHRLEVEYVNSGTDRADYHFQVRVLDAAGATAESIEATGFSIDPGQTSVASAPVVADVPDGAQLELVGAFRNPSDQPGANGIALGIATDDASADVTSLSLNADGASHSLIAVVTNSTAVASDYNLGVAVESPDGTVRFDTLFTFAGDVQPGASAETDAFTTLDIPDDAVIRLIKVQRTESFGDDGAESHSHDH